MKKLLVGFLVLITSIFALFMPAKATPYGCTAYWSYGGSSGASACDGGTGSHRIRLSCRDLSNNVVYYVYGPWKPTGWESYKYSWAYCSSLGKPSYMYDTVAALVQKSG